MAKKIKWTSEATNNYKAIEEYLLFAWNEKVLTKFATELDNAIEQIIN